LRIAEKQNHTDSAVPQKVVWSHSFNRRDGSPALIHFTSGVTDLLRVGPEQVGFLVVAR
jgi:hypothetical protein